MSRQADMQAGRQAYGLAGRRLFSGENDVFASTCVSWTFAVLVYVCEGLQALLQKTPDMPVRRQPISVTHAVSFPSCVMIRMY